MSLRVFRPGDFGRGVRISGTGSYLPVKQVTNAEVVRRGSPLTEEEIVRLSGIHTRHEAAPHEATSDLAIEACRRALIGSKTRPSEIDRLFVATVSPDHSSPATACFVQHALGLPPVPSSDLTASCSGFLYALDAAARALCTGDRHVLACAADVRSRFLDPGDRATSALFGDGAGAAVLSAGPIGSGLTAIGLLADGSGARSVYVLAGGSREPASLESVQNRRHTIRMEEGPQVYLAAVEGMAAIAEALLASEGLSVGDVDLVVPHQPNRRILDRLARVLKLGPGRLYVNVDRIGNVSGATCAIALDEALRAGLAKAGARVLLLTAGAGYTAGAALVTVDEELVEAMRKSA